MKKNGKKAWKPDLNTFAAAFSALVRPARESGERAIDRRFDMIEAHLNGGAELVLIQCTEDLGDDLGVMLEVETLAAALSVCVSSVGAIDDQKVRTFHGALVALDGGDALWFRVLTCLAAANADERFSGQIFDERFPKRALHGVTPVQKPAAASSNESLFDARSDDPDEDESDNGIELEEGAPE